jgi:hypothetical protein
MNQSIIGILGMSINSRNSSDSHVRKDRYTTTCIYRQKRPACNFLNIYPNHFQRSRYQNKFPFFMQKNVNFCIIIGMRPKLKKLFVSRTRPTVRKRYDSKYFLGDLQQLFFWLPEIVTGRSDIVPEFTFGTGLHF